MKAGSPAPPLPGIAELHSAGCPAVPGIAELHSAVVSPSPSTSPWHSRGYLPHHDSRGTYQHITFHVADSLPAIAIERMSTDLSNLPDDEVAQARRERIQTLLDAGYGSCPLKPSAHAAIVEDSLLHGDGDRYRLLEWVIMPNHVHVLLEQTTCSLAKVVQSWKRHTARQIHLLDADAVRPLWQREYWDRFIRDEVHYRAVVRYIHDNPVTARLVSRAQDWQWGSACRRQPAECNSAIPGKADRQPAECNSAIPGTAGQPAECNSAIPGKADGQPAECNSAIPEFT